MSVETIIIPVLLFAISYLTGSVPWGFLIGKLYGKDIRTLGSGNIGATNVTRVIGKTPGRICFLLDFGKGFLPVFAVTLLIRHGIIDGRLDLCRIVVASGAILGHIFTVFLKFRGGKGVAASAGALLAMTPGAFLIAGVTWLVVFLIGRYVSLASVTAAAALPVSATLLAVYDVCPASGYTLVFLYLLALLAIARHAGNIRRLCNGTEDRFTRKKPK